MSKILASIADAECTADLYVSEENRDEIKARATAARAEHAEMVEAWRIIQDSIKYDAVCFNGPTCGCVMSKAVAKLDSLLSRVGGGA